MSADTELEKLIVRYLDGSAKKGEEKELAGFLARDPSAAARFAAACRTDHALSGHFEAEASAAATRRELTDTIAHSERRESAAARAGARKARGEAVVVRCRRTVKQALRAAAVLALFAVAAYTVWPDAKDPSIAAMNIGEDSPAAEERRIIPAGQPVRASGSTALGGYVKGKLTDFHLPDASIEGENIASALDALLEKYHSLASSHGVSAVPSASIRIADGVDRSVPVSLKLVGSIPVSTALTSIALQSGARVRYTNDGAVIEPHEAKNPGEFVTREFRVSESAFQWMSAGASTTWSEPEEGISWDATSIMRAHGIPLDGENERAVYAATSQKLSVMATRENASRIDALRSAAETAGRNQIVLTSRMVTLPLESGSVDLENELPALVQTESLITDSEFKVILKGANQTKGSEIQTMPKIVSRSGQDVEIDSRDEEFPEGAMSFGMGYTGDLLTFNPDDMESLRSYHFPAEAESGDDSNLQVHITTTFVPDAGSDMMEVKEGLSANFTDLRTLELEVAAFERSYADILEESEDLQIEREYFYPAESNADGLTDEQSFAKGVAVINKDGQIGVFDAATGEALDRQAEASDPRAEMLAEIDALWQKSDAMNWKQIALKLEIMEHREAELIATFGSGHPEVAIAQKKNEILKQELMKEIHGSFDHAAAVKQHSCSDCHSSGSEEQTNPGTGMWERYSSLQAPSGKTPSLSLTAKFEGHRIRVSGEVRDRGTETQGMGGAHELRTIDLNLTPEVVEFGGFINYSPIEDKTTGRVPLLGDIPALGRLFHQNADSVVEFDAVLGSDEVLMLEVSRTATTRTLFFLEARKTKIR